MKQQFVQIPVNPGEDYDANIERMARAICRAQGLDPAELCHGHKPGWEFWTKEARAAVAAAWEAATDSG